MTMRITFIFLDGMGLAHASATNPFTVSSMPRLAALLNGPLTAQSQQSSPTLLLKGIDACLGIDGLPQSATGQTSLFTGINAAALLGYHLPAFPNEPLVKTIHETSLLKAAAEKGLSCTFANAYSPRYFELVAKGLRMHSVTTQCVLAAKLPFRTTEDLRRGEAVYWDMTNEHLSDSGIAVIEPGLAGWRCAKLSQQFDLVLYENFLPDVLGHRRDYAAIARMLRGLDEFLHAFLKETGPDHSLVVTSDHGNIEDLTTGNHTRNPVPLLAIGPIAAPMTRAESITDVMGLLLNFWRPL